MQDPVLAEDGHTYERTVIENWFARGNKTSPKTQQEIGSTVRANQTIKTLVSDWWQPQQQAGSGGANANRQLIESWLSSIAHEFCAYSEALKSLGYTSTAVLAESDLEDIEADIAELNMPRAHRRVLLKRARELQSRTDRRAS